MWAQFWLKNGVPEGLEIQRVTAEGLLGKLSTFVNSRKIHRCVLSLYFELQSWTERGTNYCERDQSKALVPLRLPKSC